MTLLTTKNFPAIAFRVIGARSGSKLGLSLLLYDIDLNGLCIGRHPFKSSLVWRDDENNVVTGTRQG